MNSHIKVQVYDSATESDALSLYTITVYSMYCYIAILDESYCAGIMYTMARLEYQVNELESFSRAISEARDI